MSKQQLDNLKKELGGFPQLEQNGRLLHIHRPLVDFHEWRVLSYNLNVLGDIVRENMELHKKLHLLTERYINEVEALSSLRSKHCGTAAGRSLQTTTSVVPSESFIGFSNHHRVQIMMIAFVTVVAVMLMLLIKRLNGLEHLVMNKLYMRQGFIM